MRACIPLLTLLAISSPAYPAVVVDFDELSSFNGTSVAPGVGQYFDGYGPGATSAGWTSQGVTFKTGAFSGGWSYSNVNNTVTAGFTNQWASFTGTDFSGDGNYAIGNTSDSEFYPAFFNLPDVHQVESVQVSTATYSALSMQNGDGFAKKFGGPSGNDPDFFKVTFTGYSGLDEGGVQTGSQDLLLADFRFADNSQDFILTDWTLLDLTPLGNARSVGISFDGSDIGGFGLNTPGYVAIDNLTLTAVPEPGSLAVLGLVGGVVALRRRRKTER